MAEDFPVFLYLYAYITREFVGYIEIRSLSIGKSIIQGGW